MNSRKPTIASGMPTMAPTTVRLTRIPTIISTMPMIIATRRPVISTMTASNFQIATNGQRYQGTSRLTCDVVISTSKIKDQRGDGHFQGAYEQVTITRLNIRSFHPKVEKRTLILACYNVAMPPKKTAPKRRTNTTRTHIIEPVVEIEEQDRPEEDQPLAKETARFKFS